MGIALARLSPRGLVDRVAMHSLRSLARRDHFGESAMAGEFISRLRAPRPRR